MATCHNHLGVYLKTQKFPSLIRNTLRSVEIEPIQQYFLKLSNDSKVQLEFQPIQQDQKLSLWPICLSKTRHKNKLIKISLHGFWHSNLKL